ncbi:MAG: hypothetical protein AB1390_11585 [Nitrospirota bacterium]
MMKKGIIVMLLASLFSGVAHAEIVIEFFTVDVYKYKGVHISSGDKLIINYFKKKATEMDTKYQYVGVEIFQDGAKIKDTFRDNDEF